MVTSQSLWNRACLSTKMKTKLFLSLLVSIPLEQGMSFDSDKPEIDCGEVSQSLWNRACLSTLGRYFYSLANNVSIPLEQGMSFDFEILRKKGLSISLNPFGTGHVFRRYYLAHDESHVGLNPFGTGHVFRPSQRFKR